MLVSPSKKMLVAALAALFLAAAGSTVQEPPSAAQNPLPVFEFHSGFWMNLHHFLYQQARLRQPAQNSPAGAPAGTTADTPEQAAPSDPGNADRPGQVPLGALTPKERQAWTAALDYYAEDLASRDLLFNGDMMNIKNRLVDLETCADLSGRSSAECASGLRQEMVAVLERAAPVYRAHWWPEHDHSNRSWIASVAPMVRQFGGTLAQQLAETYRADWPPGRIRVDVVIYGGPFGAYTSLEPTRVTLSSSDARNQGPAALEVLFHEASHALAGSVRDAIARECRRRGKPIPRDLWHALLFYTTGEVVKRTLSAPEGAAGRNSAAYTPYAYRYGLYARGWSTYQKVLERYWQPYLDGKVAFDTALARLVSAL